MSKLKEFLDQKGLDPRRVIATSKRLERLGDEDRAIRLAKQQVRAGASDDTLKEQADKKPKSGRPVTEPTLRIAMEGRPVSGPAKTRIVRAVNHLLAKKNAGETSVRELFG